MNDPDSISDGQRGFNPYSANVSSVTLGSGHAVELPAGQLRGMISQVPVLGVLMIVQGGLDVLAGIAAGGYAFIMPELLNQMRQRGAQGAPMPPQFPIFMTIGVSIFAMVIVLIGALLIYAGINVMNFRSRILAIASLCTGLLTIFTCYCFPTSLALTIYGLIAMLNPSVKIGFDLGKEGYSAQDIQRSFALLP